MKKIISRVLIVLMLSVIIFALSGCQNNTKQKVVNNDVDKSRTDEINVDKLLEDLEMDNTDESRQDKSKSKVTVPEVKYEEIELDEKLEFKPNKFYDNSNIAEYDNERIK